MPAAAIDMDYLTHPDCTDLDHIPGTDGIPYFGSSLSSIYHLPSLLERHWEKWGEVLKGKSDAEATTHFSTPRSWHT